MFGSVKGLYCTWLVPRMRASSDGVDDPDSGEWIHLKRGVDHGGCGPIGLCGHRIILCGVEDPSEVESDVGMLPEQEGVAPADAEGMDTLGGCTILYIPPSTSIGGIEDRYVGDGAGSGAGLQTYKFISDETFWLFRNMSDLRPSYHANEDVSENSQSRQPKPTGENTPRPEQGTHTLMKNFMARIMEVELRRALAPLPPMGFAAVVEATIRTEMADQAVIQRKADIGSAATPYKHLVVNKGLGMEVGEP
ncbi:hypothetical protein M9H77_22384 [Catharanthus roseus]|uniref:Uncharacterized protein n=1 Tax=Catharanthus roseus TaxID=4058 RepID=A0ACC0AUC5_CATRO|nr:hypothetical protein M9H77_22384 [Catharanthus roseus]